MSQNIENKLKEKYPSPLKMDNLSKLFIVSDACRVVREKSAKANKFVV